MQIYQHQQYFFYLLTSCNALQYFVYLLTLCNVLHITVLFECFSNLIALAFYSISYL